MIQTRHVSGSQWPPTMAQSLSSASNQRPSHSPPLSSPSPFLMYPPSRFVLLTNDSLWVHELPTTEAGRPCVSGWESQHITSLSFQPLRPSLCSLSVLCLPAVQVEESASLQPIGHRQLDVAFIQVSLPSSGSAASVRIFPWKQRIRRFRCLVVCDV